MREDCRGRTSLSRSGDRKPCAGFALPAAILLVLLIAALIAGAFSAITEETLMGAAATDRQLALLGAESAVEMTIATFSASVDSIGVGETRSRSVEGLALPVTVHITRLDSSRYWLVAEAGSTSFASGIARRIGVLVMATKGPDGSITIDRISERAWSELF
jgi:Tfp pilus assembly protein PilX